MTTCIPFSTVQPIRIYPACTRTDRHNGADDILGVLGHLVTLSEQHLKKRKNKVERFLRCSERSYIENMRKMRFDL